MRNYHQKMSNQWTMPAGHCRTAPEIRQRYGDTTHFSGYGGQGHIDSIEGEVHAQSILCMSFREIYPANPKSPMTPKHIRTTTT